MEAINLQRMRGRNRRTHLVVAGAALVVVLAGVLAIGLFTKGSTEATDPGPVHVHALGLNPSDQALFIATHRGLYRVASDEQVAEQVGDRDQDTMAFTVVGPDRFLGSGHPDLRDDLPPLLGLIESTDAGETWNPVSLLGEADFHVLRFAGDRVYGYESSRDRLLRSSDGGQSWSEIGKPGPVVDLAVSPTDSDHLLLASAGGATAEGLFESRDGGRSWKRLARAVGLLGWPAKHRLFVVTADGRVLSSSNGGRTSTRMASIGGEPAALLAQSAGELYVALHDGTIKRSTDGGVTWAVRSTP